MRRWLLHTTSGECVRVCVYILVWSAVACVFSFLLCGVTALQRSIFPSCYLHFIPVTIANGIGGAAPCEAKHLGVLALHQLQQGVFRAGGRN